MNAHNFLGFNIPVDLLNMTGGGVDNFDAIAFGHLEYLKKYIDLRPTDAVLEIGCGIGRDAIPLSKYLTTGSYDGIDIIGRSIEWCKQNIECKHSNFKFHHFNVRDKLHNPDGDKNLDSYEIPCEDASIDKIFLWSVFTHMFEKDILFYLNEFKRVLKPTGRVLITCFIVDENILKQAREVDLTPWSLRFEYLYEDGCYINNLEYPTGAVAFDQNKLVNLIFQSGLSPDLPILTGQWYGKKDGLGFGQDVILCRRSLK